MSTHPLWRPFELTDLAQSDATVVGPSRPGVVHVVPYDGRWPVEAATLMADTSIAPVSGMLERR